MAENFEPKEEISTEKKPDILDDKFRVEEVFKKLSELRKVQENTQSKSL